MRTLLLFLCTLISLCVYTTNTYAISKGRVKITGIDLLLKKKYDNRIYSIEETWPSNYTIRDDGRIKYTRCLDVKKITYESGIDKLDEKLFDSLEINKASAVIKKNGHEAGRGAYISILFKLKNFRFKQDYKFDKEDLSILGIIIAQIDEYTSAFQSKYGASAHMLEHIVEYGVGLQDANGDAVYFDDIRKEYKKQIQQENLIKEEIEKQIAERKLREELELKAKIEGELKAKIEKERDSIFKYRLLQLRKEQSEVEYKNVRNGDYQRISNKIKEHLLEIIFKHFSELPTTFSVDIKKCIQEGIESKWDICVKCDKNNHNETIASMIQEIESIVREIQISHYEKRIEYSDINRSGYISIPLNVNFHYKIKLIDNISGECVAKTRSAKWLLYIPVVNAICLTMAPSLTKQDRNVVKYIHKKKNPLFVLPENKKPKFRELPLNKKVIFTYQRVNINGSDYEKRDIQ